MQLKKALAGFAAILLLTGCQELVEDIVFFCTPTPPEGEVHVFELEPFGSGGLQDCSVTYGAGVAPCCRYTTTIPDNYRECRIRGPNTVTFTDTAWTFPGAPVGETLNNHFVGGFAEVDNLRNLVPSSPTDVESVNAPIVVGVSDSPFGSIGTINGVGDWPIPAQVGPDSLAGTVNFGEDRVRGEWHVRLYPDEAPGPGEVFGETPFQCPDDVKIRLTLTSFTVP